MAEETEGRAPETEGAPVLSLPEAERDQAALTVPAPDSDSLAMPYAQAYPQAYAQPPYPAEPPTSGLAIAGLVCSLSGILFLGIPSIVGLILSIVALGQIRDSEGRIGGRGLAIAGLVVGIVIVGLIVLYVLFVVLIFGALFSAAGSMS